MRLEVRRPTNRLLWLVIFKNNLKKNESLDSGRVDGGEEWDERDLVE